MSSNYLKNEKLDFIINIVDASLLERNLLLTLELMNLNIPMIIVLNKMDILEKKNVYINITKLEKILNVPIIPISANSGKGLNNLLDEIINKKYKKKHIINNQSAEEKFNYIDYIIKECITKNKSKDNITDKIDNLVLNNIFGIPVFLLIMFVVFYLTFSIGDVAKELFEKLLTSFSINLLDILKKCNVDISLRSLVVDGIVSGVGSILVFIPNLLILFFMLAILEDSGYMARVTYIMNEKMKKLGLPGKGIIPLILGFGCSVPAVMSTRILENYRDRLKVMLIIPFMSCYAKIPIYILISDTFFGKYSSFFSFGMYILRYNSCIYNAYNFKEDF